MRDGSGIAFQRAILIRDHQNLAERERHALAQLVIVLQRVLPPDFLALVLPHFDRLTGGDGLLNQVVEKRQLQGGRRVDCSLSHAL